MPTQASYRKRLEKELGGMIETLNLPDLQKRFLRSRWLDQVLWLEGQAPGCRAWYYTLRLTTIIGGLLLPALVSLKDGDVFTSAVNWVTFGLSLLVAISAAVEQSFHFGERWRHYRRTVELLKIEGWQFFQLSGPYRRYKNQADAHPVFAARVEDIIRQDVEVYITEVVREKEEEKEKPGAGGEKESEG